MAKPTYDELQQALQTIVTDCFNTYDALKHNDCVVITIGQWGRIAAAQEIVGRIADADSA